MTKEELLAILKDYPDDAKIWLIEGPVEGVVYLESVNQLIFEG